MAAAVGKASVSTFSLGSIISKSAATGAAALAARSNSAGFGGVPFIGQLALSAYSLGIGASKAAVSGVAAIVDLAAAGFGALTSGVILSGNAALSVASTAAAYGAGRIEALLAIMASGLASAQDAAGLTGRAAISASGYAAGQGKLLLSGLASILARGLGSGFGKATVSALVYLATVPARYFPISVSAGGDGSFSRGARRGKVPG
jgi:hypothetical protein